MHYCNELEIFNCNSSFQAFESFSNNFIKYFSEHILMNTMKRTTRSHKIIYCFWRQQHKRLEILSVTYVVFPSSAKLQIVKRINHLSLSPPPPISTPYRPHTLRKIAWFWNSSKKYLIIHTQLEISDEKLLSGIPVRSPSPN